jgi:hypothetical protein
MHIEQSISICYHYCFCFCAHYPFFLQIATEEEARQLETNRGHKARLRNAQSKAEQKTQNPHTWLRTGPTYMHTHTRSHAPVGRSSPRLAIAYRRSASIERYVIRAQCPPPPTHGLQCWIRLEAIVCLLASLTGSVRATELFVQQPQPRSVCRPLLAQHLSDDALL